MLLARRSQAENALDAALQRLTGPSLPDRLDTPDLHVTAVRRLPAVSAQYAPFPPELDQRLIRALSTRGLSELYTHQAEAIENVLSGRHTVIVTPTASGKTLCYNAPVLNAILQDPSSRALYLFPTKALAQDQLAELQAMCETLSGTEVAGPRPPSPIPSNLRPSPVTTPNSCRFMTSGRLKSPLDVSQGQDRHE